MGIKQELQNIEDNLLEISDSILDQILEEEFDLVDISYLKFKFKYEILRDNYIKINSIIPRITSSNYSDSIFSLYLKRALLIRTLIESTIKSNKTFENEFLKDFQGLKKLTLTFPSKAEKHKAMTLAKIFKLLVKEKRVKNEHSQRKVFLSLFGVETNPKGDKIDWQDYGTDLRGFLMALIDADIISFNPSDLNEFAYDNFNYKNNQGKLIPVDKTNFRTYQGLSSTLKCKDKWIDFFRNSTTINVKIP